MKEVHSQGKTIDDIVKVLQRAPIHPRIVPAIKTAHALGYSPSHNFFFQRRVSRASAYARTFSLLLLFPLPLFSPLENVTKRWW